MYVVYLFIYFVARDSESFFQTTSPCLVGGEKEKSDLLMHSSLAIVAVQKKVSDGLADYIYLLFIY
jgi:hypothetical protein